MLFDALKILHASVEEARRHAEMYCNKGQTLNDWFKTKLNEFLASILRKLQITAAELVKQRDFSIKKSFRKLLM